MSSSLPELKPITCQSSVGCCRRRAQSWGRLHHHNKSDPVAPQLGASAGLCRSSHTQTGLQLLQSTRTLSQWETLMCFLSRPGGHWWTSPLISSVIFRYQVWFACTTLAQYWQIRPDNGRGLMMFPDLPSWSVFWGKHQGLSVASELLCLTQDIETVHRALDTHATEHEVQEPLHIADDVIACVAVVVPRLYTILHVHQDAVLTSAPVIGLALLPV